MNAQIALVATVLLPLLGALLVTLLRGRPGVAAPVGTLAALLGAASAVSLLALAPPWRQGADATAVDLPWIGLLGSRLHLGWDGITAPLVILTSVLGALVCAYVWRGADTGEPDGDPRTPPGLLVALLLTQAAAVATLTARDLLVFFIGFEAVLVPMWVVVARWGSDVRLGRRTITSTAAAIRFVVYTVTGSAVMLLGLLLLALEAGTTDLVELARLGPDLSTGTQVLVTALLLIGLGVKVPVWPVHSWLPAAHTAAPTVGSVMLAAVLLKLGSYGLVRLVAGLVPDGLAVLALPLAILGVVGILWGGLVCLVENDLKRLVAYSSVAHMGFVVVGVASGTPEGVQGALFAGVAHGVITGLLFWVVGMLKHRRHTADLVELRGGLRDALPRLGWLLALAAIAGAGLPGLAGFWGEILAVIGAWKGDTFLGGAAVPVAVLAAVGTALAAAYLFRVLYLVWHGTPDEDAAVPVPEPGADVTRLELAVTAPLVGAALALGVAPWLLLSMSGPAVRLMEGLGS